MTAMQAWTVSRTAWAAEVEKEEAENGGEIKPPEATPKMMVGGGESAFPSLGDAAKVKETKKDKKKKLTLNEFLTSGPSSANIVLPKAPRGKDDNVEESGGFRNGFKDSYGRARTSRSRDMDSTSDAGSADYGPSRADMSDNWGKDSKYQSSRGGFGQSRSSSFGRTEGFDDRSFDGPSRADAAPSWGSRQGGARFEDRPRGGFDDGPSRGYEFSSTRDSSADTQERWTRKAPLAEPPEGSGSRWGSSRAPSGPGDAPPASGRPRLNLAPRTLPLPESAVKDTHSTSPPPEPSKAAPVVPKPKVNPFGAARPREEVLKEKEAKRSAEQCAPFLVFSAPFFVE
eukprot:jgi/Botrbrau1/7696/Bobra.0159s0134.2